MGPTTQLHHMQQFDEASSESDDESTTSDDSANLGRKGKQQKPHSIARTRSRENDIDDEDASSDSSGKNESSDSSDGDDISSTTGDAASNQPPDFNENAGDSENESDSTSGEEDGSESDEDMALHERIRRKEEQGVILKKSRQRKSLALEVANERLATLKMKAKGKLKGKKTTDDTPKTYPSKTKEVKSKHKPTEMSSKRADFFRRGAPKLNESGIGVQVGAKRYQPVDPRVSTLSGHFNEEQFVKNYAFLEEMRNQEIGQFRKRVAAYKATGDKGRRLRRKLGLDGIDPSRLEEDEAHLKALTQERADLERRKIERTAQQTVKRRIRDEVESGKRGAYFLKRKEKKRLELEEKLREIQKRGGKKAVEKMLDKKRRRNKSRDAGLFAK
jgi:ribosomal RNA-processing protein 36